MTTGTYQITADRFQRQGNPTIGSVSRFLVVMASVSLASKIVEWLASSVLAGEFGVMLDPFGLSVARQVVVMLIGIGVAYRVSRHGQDAAARRHMLLTPLVAMGIGLMLAWLGQLVGQTNAFDWPVALVYLLWAWGSAVTTV
jgi:putative flippase GtrA